VFAPSRLSQTIHDLAAVQQAPAADAEARKQAAQMIAECDGKLAQYRAALDAGASPATVAAWIAETEAERARHEMAIRQPTASARMNEDQIQAMIAELGDMAATLRDANPDDKSATYRELGLKLTYSPGRQVVRGVIDLTAIGHWFFDSVRGGT
jgi:hypothetical protein